MKKLFIFPFLFVLIASTVLGFCYEYDDFNYNSVDDLVNNGYQASINMGNSLDKIRLINGQLVIDESVGIGLSGVVRNFSYGGDMLNNADSKNFVTCSIAGDNVTIETNVTVSSHSTPGTTAMHMGIGMIYYTASGDRPHYMRLSANGGGQFQELLSAGTNLFYDYSSGTTYNIKYELSYNGSRCMNNLYVDDVIVNSNLSAPIKNLYQTGFSSGTGVGSGTVRYDFISVYDTASGSEDCEGFVPYYNDTGVANETVRAELDDVVGNFWEANGLQTTGSKTMFGLFLLFFIALATIGVQLKSGQGVSVSVTSMVIIVASFLFVYIGLLPVWLVVVMTILTGGIGFLAVKTMASGG